MQKGFPHMGEGSYKNRARIEEKFLQVSFSTGRKERWWCIRLSLINSQSCNIWLY